jgi:DNA-binding NtrC family response regulator
MTRASVLVIDDDDAFRFAVGKALRRLGYEVDEAASGEDALVRLSVDPPPDAALLDLRMKGIDGLEVLRRRRSTRTRVIVLTGHGTVQAAVEAMKLGAFSFLEKPIDAEVLGPLLEQATGAGPTDAPAGETFSPPLVGSSDVMRAVRAFVDRVGPTDETVAIYGETGTGKEVVARQVHLASPRRSAPFVAMNAACVPRELFESELFGHKKGAFTGATSDRLGLFREAEGGTLFIDELAELPAESQAKLLRALEGRTIRPIGESREHRVDVRIVAATNRDLWSEVSAGRFREDLYFRLQVFPIVVPPLREHAGDLAALVEHLLGRIAGPRRQLTDDALAALAAYDWPGNVRELLNVLRRASLFAEGGTVDGELVRKMIAASVFGQVSSRPSAVPRVETVAAASQDRISASSLADVERDHIARVLRETGGNVTRAAQGPRERQTPPSPLFPGVADLFGLVVHLRQRPRDAHLAHAAALGIEHLHVQAVDVEGLPYRGDVPEVTQEKTADRLESFALDRHMQPLGNFVDVCRPAEHERAPDFLNDRLGLDVIFVANLAENLLDQVLEGHESGGAAVFVDDDGALNALVLELPEQFADELGLGHKVRGPQMIRERRVLLQRVAEQNEVLHVHEAEDVVEVVAKHRKTRVLLLAEEGPEAVERLLRGYRHDVGARRHHFTYECVAEIDDRFEQLAFLLAVRPARLVQ